MTQITGIDGAVLFGVLPATLTEIRVTGWKLDKAAKTADFSDSGTGNWEEHQRVGRLSFTGSFEGFRHSGAGALPEAGDTVDFEFIEAPNIKHTGKAIVTGEGITVNIAGGDGVVISRNIQGTGILTTTITPA